jgi:hypothetical protein
MSLRSSVNRILIIGRENGPLAKQIKKIYPDMKVGSVDILGNLDTRNSVETAFSVVKQTPGDSLERRRARSNIDLLYELALVMLDEVEFDILIPLAPFNTNPEYLRSLSNRIELPIVDWKNLDKTSSSWKFLSHLSKLIPSSSLKQRLIKFDELIDINGEDGLFVTSKGNFSIDRNKNLTTYSPPHDQGFFLPIKEIHCAAFYSSSRSITNIGVQTVKPPLNHSFFYDEIEKNAYLPFNSLRTFSTKELIEYLVEIIKQVQPKGFLTLYFGIYEKNIIPISCNSIPDEKIDLWNKINASNLIPLLIEPSDYHPSLILNKVYGYNFPIFTSHSIKVPMIPKEVAEQRNLPGVYNTPEYPVCTIQNISDDVNDLSRKLELNMKQIHEILG